MKEVQSLWVDLEVMCIKSFQKVGHSFILYTYEKVKDANTIIKKNCQSWWAKFQFQFSL